MLAKATSYLGIFFLVLLSLLPLSVLYFMAGGVNVILYHIVGYRRAIVRENLKNAFPEKSDTERLRIEKEFYRYLANLMVEIVKMNTISREELKKRFRFEQMELMEDYFKEGKSVLVCAAHYGNWEWGNVAIGIWFSAINYAIYKPLNNPVFDHWFKKIRSRFGNRMIAMRQTLRAIAVVNDGPTIFSFGNDQAPSKDESHYWTTFLHQQTSVQLGIEKVAKKTNRPVFYLRVNVLKRGYYRVSCQPLCLHPQETKAYEITELHTQFLEKMIMEEPAYWLWSHRRWKNQPYFANN